MKKIFIFIIIIFIISFSIIFISYKKGISNVNNKSKEIDFYVEEGSNFYNIASKLKEEGLIKSEFYYKVYIKLHKVSNIQSGVFVLNQNMSVEDITNKLQGNSTNPNVISITFKEGYNMDDIIKEIEKNTDNKKEDIIKILNDKDYLNSLIYKYWFIDESILNNNLYYSLEGYLYPSTYQFDDKTVTPDMIFNVMINQMGQRIDKYKKEIEKNNYSFHQLLSLSSVVELEGLKSEDRAGIAGVFYNRINKGMNLGSDVTTYYSARVKMSERDLYVTELEADNPYNTRSSSMAGKLPIGPICSPSIESIEVVLRPEKNDYLFFVADKNGKTYFSKTGSEHTSIINKLKAEGLWYTY